MVKKKKSVKKEPVKKKIDSSKKTKKKKLNLKNIPTLQLKTERDIAMDFAVKAYKQFDKAIKSIVLFGSVAKKQIAAGSDIDIILVLDDVAIQWDQEAIAWYRAELNRILKSSPYNEDIHINTIKLSTWWQDLIRGDPTLLNILRYGESLVDFAGFFEPLKLLLINGKIKATPEAIYTCLQRAPMHIAKSKAAELSSIEGLYWAMVDSAHAALIAAGVQPASPEHIPVDLNEVFVNQGKLDSKYASWYKDLLILHKEIMHKKISDLKGVEIDEWQDRTEEFLKTMAILVKDLIETRNL